MQTKKQLNIYLAFAIIAVILFLVWLFIYIPNYGNTISAENADWGAFGDFFWGLGNMLIAGLNVYVFHQLTITFEQSRRAREEETKHLHEQQLTLQKKQIKIEQQLTLLKDVNNIVREAKVILQITDDLYSKITFTLMSLQTFHQLFPTLEIRQITLLIEKIKTCNQDNAKVWIEQTSSNNQIYIPVNKRHIEIIQELIFVQQILWEDLYAQMNS